MILYLDPVDLYLGLTISFHKLKKLFPEYIDKLKEFRSNCVTSSDLLNMKLNTDYINKFRTSNPVLFNSIISNI